MYSSSTYLYWDCDQKVGSGTGAVLCSNEVVDDFSCKFGVVNVTNECDCSSEAIVSNVAFLAPSAGGDEILSCTNGSEGKNITLSIPGKN